MIRITLACGSLLVALGIVGYVGAETKSITALFPAFVGVVLWICGVLAAKESLRMHAMHIAATVGLLGALLGWGRGLMKISVLFSEEGNKRAVVMVLLMAVICTVFVGLCVQSFIAARKRQRQTESAE